MARQKDDPPARISEGEMRTALARSGYLLETRLEAVLHESQWRPETNIGIPDPITGKSRELDLSASRDYHVEGKPPGFLKAQLLIECVNNPQPVAFFAKQSQGGERNIGNVLLISHPRGAARNVGNRQVSVKEDIGFVDFHHYPTARVATQFCSFVKKAANTEWMAKHEDEHYDSFRKLAIAAQREVAEWEPKRRRVVAPWMVCVYPIVVVQGELMEVAVSDMNFTLKPVDHIGFVYNVATATSADTYQFDVVTERYFPSLLETIAKEAEAVRDYISRNLERLRKAGGAEDANRRGPGTVSFSTLSI